MHQLLNFFRSCRAGGRTPHFVILNVVKDLNAKDGGW